VAPEKAAALTYAHINKRVIDSAAIMDDPALRWTQDDVDNRPGSEQRGGGPAAVEKPIFFDTFAEGEEVMTVTHDEVSETWLRDKYKGIQFVDKDIWSPRSTRTAPCSASSGCGVAAQGPSRGGCSAAGTSSPSWTPDADKHPDVDVDDDQFNEDYPIGEVLWPMIRDSAVMRAKSRF
jgi:hypothetical protein